MSGETRHFVALMRQPGAALIKASAVQRCHRGVSSPRQEKQQQRFHSVATTTGGLSSASRINKTPNGNEIPDEGLSIFQALAGKT